MLAILEGIVWLVLIVLDLAGLVWQIVILPSTLREALRQPLRSLLWLISAGALGAALAVWQERADVGLAVGSTVVGVGACALAVVWHRRHRAGPQSEMKHNGMHG